MHFLQNVGTKVTRYQNICQIIQQNKIIKQFSLITTPNCANQTSFNEAGRKQNFNELISQRRQEAQRSILVQVNSEKSFAELQTYCSQFGEIKSAHHYKLPEDELHYILLEYSQSNEVEAAIESSAYNDDFYGVPVQSPFLWFRAGSKKNRLKIIPIEGSVKMVGQNATSQLPETELQDLLTSAASMDDQIKVLHAATCLNDTGIRLRFLAARQLEKSVTGMFPKAQAYPFGSSVNGFGKVGCDLDLILRLDSEDQRKRPESRLVFHTKENLSNGRSQTQRQMESIGDLLHLFLPGVCNVRRILQARVPIIKYRHEHLDLEVDLSMSNMTGVYMSELLFMFGQIDKRVRPLTFCIRRWAQIVGLTNASPGRWISNFSLTCLVIFFLQRLQKPILPPIQLLIDSATTDDMRITEDQINCTFTRDLNRLQFTSENQSSLTELLLQFFEFYSQFDFGNRGISLNAANHILKPDHSPIYIVNPLESSLNVSKNVSIDECERLRIEVRNAAWILDSTDSLKVSDASWGIANIFKTGKQSIVRPQMFFKPRMFEVSDLFSEEEMATGKKTTNIKNETTKAFVNSIEKKGKRDLKQMKLENGSFGLTVSRTRRR